MFQALLISNDRESIDTLTPVLSGFGVDLQCCGASEAPCKLAEQRLDAVIVDFDDPQAAARLLQSTSQTGTSPLTISLLTDKSRLRQAFGAGANFVLYKPISSAQAETSLRAAIAVLKRERRRCFRVGVQVPVQIRSAEGSEVEGILLDLSEEGADVLAAQPLCPSARIGVQFTLPHGDLQVETWGEVAWANPNGQSGLRFVDVPEALHKTLASWVVANAPELPPEDAEAIAHCNLTDLSSGGCYVETGSPFPECSGISLTVRAGTLEVHMNGIVRVMHPGFGMGVEFAGGTARQQVSEIITFLTSHAGTKPELAVTPRTLVAGREANSLADDGTLDDPLLELLLDQKPRTQEEFLLALQKQRNEVVAAY